MKTVHPLPFVLFSICFFHFGVEDKGWHGVRLGERNVGEDGVGLRLFEAGVDFVLGVVIWLFHMFLNIKKKIKIK